MADGFLPTTVGTSVLAGDCYCRWVFGMLLVCCTLGLQFSTVLAYSFQLFLLRAFLQQTCILVFKIHVFYYFCPFMGNQRITSPTPNDDCPQSFRAPCFFLILPCPFHFAHQLPFHATISTCFLVTGFICRACFVCRYGRTLFLFKALILAIAHPHFPSCLHLLCSRRNPPLPLMLFSRSQHAGTRRPP